MNELCNKSNKKGRLVEAPYTGYVFKKLGLRKMWKLTITTILLHGRIGKLRRGYLFYSKSEEQNKERNFNFRY